MAGRCGKSQLMESATRRRDKRNTRGNLLAHRTNAFDTESQRRSAKCRAPQTQNENGRSARYVFGRCHVIAHVVRGHPVFIAPNITQEHQHEPGDVEDEFFNWNRSAHRGYFPTECGRFIWEDEESVTK